MRAMARRLARLENRFVPQETEESQRLRERLRLAYQRVGLPYPEPSQLGDYDARHLSLGERILLARRRSQRTSRS